MPHSAIASALALSTVLSIIPAFYAQLTTTPRSDAIDIGAISVAISPKFPVSSCSGETQRVVCQIQDLEKRLRKQMHEQDKNTGYHGYIDFLLAREPQGSKPNDHSVDKIIAERQISDLAELTKPIEMEIGNITIHDAGTYHCKVVWHGYFTDKLWNSENFLLGVYDCITLDKQLMEVSVKDNVTLQCVDVDVPVKWFKDGEDLDELLARGTTKSDKVGPLVQPGIKTVQMKSEEWAGIYQCRATFEKTQQIFIKETEIIMKTAPTPPFNINTYKRSPTSVILKWQQMPVINQYIRAEPTFFTILYRPIEGGPFKHKTVLKIPEVMLTDLNPNTVYFVRIQAENELGASPEATRIVVTPEASKIIQVDKRLLNLMGEHVKVLEQDLGSIASVIEKLTVPEEMGAKELPSAATTKKPDRKKGNVDYNYS